MKKKYSNNSSEIIEVNREIQVILNRRYRERAIESDIKELEDKYRRKAGWRKKLYIDFLSIEKIVESSKDEYSKSEISKCWKAIRKLDEKMNLNQMYYSSMLKLHINLITFYGFKINNISKATESRVRTTKNPNLILCEYCQTPLKEKNLQKHLLNKCSKRNINFDDDINKENNKKKSDKNNLIPCEYCSARILEKNLKKHLKKCPNSKERNKKKVVILPNSIDFLNFLKERIVVLNNQLSMLVDRNLHDKILKDIQDSKILNLDAFSDSSKPLYRMLEEHFYELKYIEKDSTLLQEIVSIECLYCKYCDKLIVSKDYENHYSECSQYKKITGKKSNLIREIEEEKVVVEKNIVIGKENSLQDELKSFDLLEEKNQKLKEQILKHKSEIEQYDEDINDELLTNEEQYYDNIRKKIEYDIRNYKKIDREKILKQYVCTTKKSAIDTTLRNEIRSYLYKIYRGYCQICGFTFRKSDDKDKENSFEMHNWDNKLVVKSKSYLVSSSGSLCLCRNCSANIKFGAFNPLFVDKIHSLKSKSIDEVKELICNKVSREDIVDRFQEFYEWDDMYALEITVNDEPKNIYMTNGHLIQFIAYLQLEERR